MTASQETDARKVLEEVRASYFAERFDAALLATIYTIEHEQQFEDDRGPVQAKLRDLITDATGEPS